MTYPWPIGNADMVLQEALDIALDYLEYTGQALAYSHTERLCATIIIAAWKAGIKHRIRLANCAIVAVESKNVTPLSSLYPRIGTI